MESNLLGITFHRDDHIYILKYLLEDRFEHEHHLCFVFMPHGGADVDHWRLIVLAYLFWRHVLLVL